MKSNLTKSIFFKHFSAALTISMLLVACLLIPKYNVAYFGDTRRCMILLGVVILFGITQLFREKKAIHFYSVDLAWIGLVLFTGCSMIWSSNEIYAMYGLVTTSLLYLCYKAFELMSWEGKSKFFLEGALVFCFTMVMGMQFWVVRDYFFPEAFSGHGFDLAFLRSIGANLNWLGSYLLVLFPFLLFRPGKMNSKIAGIILVAMMPLLYVSSAAQVMIGAIFLLIFYMGYKAKIAVKYMGYLMLGLGVILGGSLFILYLVKGNLRGISFILDEFYSQNDRFWMWDGCWEIFKSAPLTGGGKNSWALAVGEFGFHGCGRCHATEFNTMRFTHAHNSVFQIMGELGIPGLLLYGYLSIFPLIQLWRNKIQLSPLALSALVSVILYFFVSLMYGVLYNYFNHFCGLTVLSVFNLALLTQLSKAYQKTKFTLSSQKFYVGYIVLGFLGFFFFYNLNTTENNLKRGNTFFVNKKYEKAITAFSEALPFSDPSRIYHMLAASHKRIGQLEVAMGFYKKAIAKDPYWPKLNYEYASLLFRTKNYKTAQAVSLNTYDNMIQRYIPNEILLVKCYLKNGEREKALRLKNKLNERLRQRIDGAIPYIEADIALPESIQKLNARMEKQLEVLNSLF